MKTSSPSSRVGANASYQKGRGLARTVGLLIAALLLPQSVVAVVQTGKLDVHSQDKTTLSASWFVSQASFGEIPSMDAGKMPRRTLALPPDENPLMCENVSPETEPTLDNAMLVIPRGNCTFEKKAINAQKLGASGILIYGSLGSRYSLNASASGEDGYPTVENIVWPENKYDYDCQKGHAMVPAPDFSFDPLPYNSQQNDPLLSGDTDASLCHSYSDDQLRNCDSKLCLLTGNKSSSGDLLEACCAWDMPIWLFNDPSLRNTSSEDYTDVQVNISAAYLTMEQGNALLDAMQVGSVEVVLSSRYRPSYNPSAVLIWLLGVFICALAAYMSAADYRWSYRRHQASQAAAAAAAAEGGDDSSRGNGSRGGRSNQNQPPTLTAQEDSLELTPWHALGFIIMASSGLMILFIFKIYNVVKVMYTIGCSSAIIQVIFAPIVAKIAKHYQYKDKIVWRTGTEDFGDITILDIVSSICGFGVGLSWLYIALTARHPDQIAYYWVVQDIMGACMCIVFLGVIKLNSIKVASTLLIVAFLYDIFFVFITPLIFQGESVMITVATSGGPPKADPSFCEKYPDDADCQGGDPLPMLLTMPRLFDYLGGASLLGLGDIVLPGLLLSFASRLDTAKALVGIVGGGRGNLTSSACPEQRFCWGCGLCSGGYYQPLVIAYAVGLMMANMAVYLMEMGQPALLYLVPCTLGTMSFMGWRRGELLALWEGPRVLAMADTITYGGNPPATTTTESAEPGSDTVEVDAEDPLRVDSGSEEAVDAAPLLTNTNK